MQILRNMILMTMALLLFAAAPIESFAREGGEGGKDRPFKGFAVSTSNTFTPENPAPDIFQPQNPNNLPILGYFDITYVGRATHMGKITRQEYAVLYADGSFEGLMFWKAANGDELISEFDGSLTSLVPPADGSGCYTFIGGTGRFENASGVTCFEVFTPDFVDVFVTFDGTISY